MLLDPLYREAAEIVAGEPVSIEPDGSVWVDSDRRDIDQAEIIAEYDRLVAAQAEQNAARVKAVQDAQAELKDLGLSASAIATISGYPYPYQP